MIPVPVTLCARDPAISRYDTTGFVPFRESPLAVTSDVHWNEVDRKWVETTAWKITHRATGLNLGDDVTWSTREEAMAVLERCDPAFPGWAVASWSNKPALVACRAKFRWATNG